MAAYELIIKAISLNDLESAIKVMAARFPGLAADAPAARRPGRPKAVDPTPLEEAIDAVQASEKPAAGGALGGAAVGTGSAVGSQEAAAAEAGHDTAAEAAAEAADRVPEEEDAAEEAAESGEGTPEALARAPREAAARATDAVPGEAAGAPAASASPPTLEDLKAATRELIGKSDIAVATKIFGDLGISKPGHTPPEKIAPALAAVRAALAGL